MTVSGGSGKYKFTWTGPSGFTASSKDITGLQAGTYNLTADDGDCHYTGSWDVPSNCPPQVCTLSDAPTITSATACNTANGSVKTAISGGSGNYSYTWYNSSLIKTGNSQNLTGAVPGYYILYVQDLTSDVCSRYFYYTIKSAFKISYTTVNNASCAPPYSGTIKAVPSGGSGVYVYTWTYPNGKKKTGGSSLSNLHGGTYQLEVLDVTLGCSLQQSIYVFNPTNGLIVTGTPQPSTTCSPANGNIILTVTNGSGNYLYTWIAPDATLAAAKKDLLHAAPGQYNLFLNDTSSACTAYKTYTIDNKISSLPTLDSTVIANTNCASPFNGSISITPNGAGPFLYSWSTPSGFKAATKSVSSLAPDDYTVVLTDSASGCTHASQITVPDQSFPSATVNIDNVMDVRSCTSPNGGISVSVDSPDNAPYTLSLSDSTDIITASFDKLKAGTYVLTTTMMCNRVPVITPPVVEATDKSMITLRLSDFISDRDNNLDTASFQILEKPVSGADAIIRKGTLQLDYKNVTFSGTDKLTIKACDLLKACTENSISITVDAAPEPLSGDIRVYNAISANRDNLNSYLRIENVEQYTSKVFIYNRWGDQVFEVDNYNNAVSCKRFEGIDNDGKSLPTGTYFYKIEFAENKPAVTGYLALKTE